MAMEMLQLTFPTVQLVVDTEVITTGPIMFTALAIVITFTVLKILYIIYKRLGYKPSVYRASFSRTSLTKLHM